MTVWTTSVDASTVSGNIPVRKTRMATIPFTARGLRPKSRYTLWFNGVDMTWACKTPGSRMGDPLITDDTGSISISLFSEINPISSVSNQLSTMYYTIVLKDVAGNSITSTVIKQNLVEK